MNEINTWPGSEWRTVRKIMQNNYGTIYEIERSEMDRIYKAAVKVIPVPKDPAEIDEFRASGMKDAQITSYYSEAVERFVREYDLLARLKGFTNIVSCEDYQILHDPDSLQTHILIRMEFLTPLKEFILSTPLSEDLILKLGTDISSALEVCHSQNIFHRDINSANIFINQHGDFKLGDFGMAKLMDENSPHSHMTVTDNLRSISPEAYYHRPYNRTIDIYGLGLVLYELLNNRRGPFLPLDRPVLPEDYKKAARKRMRDTQIPEPANGSPLLKKVILKAIAFHPDDRFQSASDFKKALLQAQLGIDTSVSTTPAAASVSFRAQPGFRPGPWVRIPDPSSASSSDEPKVSRKNKKRFLRTT